MEPEGADRVFRRSIITHKLRYNDLYSDGDSESYDQVKDTYFADGVQVIKTECTGHVGWHSTQKAEERKSWPSWERETH